MCWSYGTSTRGRVPIRLVTYKSWKGRSGGLKGDLRGMFQANMDLGIFQEKNLTDGIYTLGLAGYSVVTTDVPSRQRGKVTVFYRPAPHLEVEAIHQFGTNVVGFHLTIGEWRWSIVGCYLAPDDTLKI